MLTKNSENKRSQPQIISIDDLVPEDHLLRLIDKAIDWSFIYDLVEDKYCLDNGRPSMDPVTLIKLPIIQYLYGIPSMRKTIEEIKVNVAYRWFLGLDLTDPVPHFSTFSKNYTRRFAGTDLFEQIFMHILSECMKQNFIDTEHIFIDGTHVKARANRHKTKQKLVQKSAVFYEKQLKEEIALDRKAHHKKPFKDRDNHDQKPPTGKTGGSTKEIKVSTTDPESGWFHKGEHKQVFAYNIQTACDKYGWILGYSVDAGNVHDSRAFYALYQKINVLRPKYLIADAGYKIPAIAKLLTDNGITPVFPYKRPMTKKGFFKKYEYAYDEYYDCYICPNNQVLKYATTNREGYKEYKSNPQICKTCPYLSQCTASKNHVKVVSRHVWQEYLDNCEDIRHSLHLKGLYGKRKETIERIFGTAKEFHGFRYTQMYGKARMKMKVGLTFACMNLKKMARRLSKKEKDRLNYFLSYYQNIKNRIRVFFECGLSTVCNGPKGPFFIGR